MENFVHFGPNSGKKMIFLENFPVLASPGAILRDFRPSQKIKLKIRF